MIRRVGSFGAIAALLHFSAAAASATTITDGDFSSWTSTYTANSFSTYTAAVEPTGGNPGVCYLSEIDDDGMILRAANIKTDYTNRAAVEGDPFTLSVDYLAGPIGLPEETVGLIVAQEGSIWYDDLGPVTGAAQWATFSESGTFDPSDFSLLTGSGQPDFDGGVPTQFGLYTHQQQIDGELSLDFDNFSLSSPHLDPVPEPGTLAIAATSAALFLGYRWRLRAGKPFRF